MPGPKQKRIETVVIFLVVHLGRNETSLEGFRVFHKLNYTVIMVDFVNDADLVSFHMRESLNALLLQVYASSYMSLEIDL